MLRGLPAFHCGGLCRLIDKRFDYMLDFFDRDTEWVVTDSWRPTKLPEDGDEHQFSYRYYTGEFLLCED